MTDDASDALSPEREQALAALRQVFEDGELEYKEISPTSLMVELPGEKKLQTPCRFDVGRHALEVHAFVCRKPDENFEGVYRWLLERNMKMYAVSFGLDGMGDIYLDARLPLVRGHDRGDRPAARRGAGVRRRVVQHDPRARVRLLDPQGVGVADLPWRADPQPRGVPRAAGARRAGDARGERSSPAPGKPSAVERAASGWAGSGAFGRGLRRATATPTRASTPPAYAIAGGASDRKTTPSTIVIGGTR